MLRYIFAVFFFSLGLLSGCSSKKNLDTPKARENYAWGQLLALQVKQQKFEIDPDLLADSVRSALKGEPPQMTFEELKNFSEEFSLKQQAAANMVAEKEFLQKNGTREGVKTLPSGVQVEIMKAGKGKQPTPTDAVRVHFKGMLLDGSVFRSTYDDKTPLDFKMTDMLKGWQEGLSSIPEGSNFRIFIPSALGYGATPPKGIPPNATLVIEGELLKVMPAVEVVENSGANAASAPAPAKKAKK